MDDIRIPPSLKWLLTKRARLLGITARYRKTMAELPKVTAQISEAETKLASLKAKHARLLDMEKLLELHMADTAPNLISHERHA